MTYLSCGRVVKPPYHTDLRNTEAMTPFRQIQVASSVDQIVGQITEILRSNGFGVGEQLPSERQLAERFGVSRPTVREALRTLSAVGVLEVRRGVGTFVRTIDVTTTLGTKLSDYHVSGANPVDAIEIRTLLEPGFAALAAERANEKALERMESSLRTAEGRISQGQLYLRADKEFHTSIVASIGSRLAEEAIAPSLNIWFSGRTDASTATMRAPGRLAKYHEQHLRIFQAIKEGDSARAFEEMKQHSGGIKEDFRIVGYPSTGD